MVLWRRWWVLERFPSGIARSEGGGHDEISARHEIFGWALDSDFDPQISVKERVLMIQKGLALVGNQRGGAPPL